MDRRIESAVSQFLRTYDGTFSANDISAIIKSFGQKTSKDEISEFLDNDDRVFPLEGRVYMTRAGAFTGMFFSFVPTQQEIDQKLFVPGDRCIPFVDSEILSCHLKFEYGGRILPKTVFETDCNTARELFTFFGDEYSSQYIGADPVNADLCLANNNFELPPKLKLTGVSLKRVFEDCDFKKGDRILCRVTNWDKGIVEIFPLPGHSNNPFIRNAEIEDRQKWIASLEKALLNSFEKMGPCQSMEQQLSFAFYENRALLCSPECASIHEFLNETTKVGMELFGVETRLWKKGENVPAVGPWNKDIEGYGINNSLPMFAMSECLIDCLIKDQFYEKKDDLPAVLDRLFPESVVLSPEEEEFFTLQIMNRSAILRQHYNWFADFGIGSIRHKALDLYSRVGELVFDIDSAGSQLEKFPQQELVTLSQLFTHISRILEMLASGNECADEEKTALRLSLEGMEYNFEDIGTRLRAAVDKFRAGQFKVI